MEREFLCGTRKVVKRDDGKYVVQCATCDDTKTLTYHSKQDAIDRCVSSSGKPCKCGAE